MNKNLMNFSSFNESKEELPKHKQLSKELKELKKKREQLLVVRPKKEKDSDVIKLDKEIENKDAEYKKALEEKK